MRERLPLLALRDILHRHASSVANGVAEIDGQPSHPQIMSGEESIA